MRINKLLIALFVLLLTLCLAGCGEEELIPEEEKILEEIDVPVQYTELSWINDTGAAGYFGSVFEKDDSLVFYDFADLSYRTAEVSNELRSGKIMIHHVYLWNDQVFAFTVRAEEQGGNNHIIEKDMPSIFLKWDLASGNLSITELDNKYYMYGRRAWVNESDEDHFYVLGCLVDDPTVHFLQVDTEYGSIEDLGSYKDNTLEEINNLFDLTGMKEYWQNRDGAVYGYKAEQTEDDVLQSLYRLENAGKDPVCLIEDLYPKGIGRAESRFQIIENKLYYIGKDSVVHEPGMPVPKVYMFCADLMTGDIKYRPVTEAESNKEVVGRAKDYLILCNTLSVNTTGVLRPQDILVISEKDFDEGIGYISFSNAS